MKIVLDITPITSRPRTGIARITLGLFEAFSKIPGVTLVPFALTARGHLRELRKEYRGLTGPQIPARLTKFTEQMIQVFGVPMELLAGRADAAITTDWYCLPLRLGKTVAVVADCTPLTNPGWHKEQTIIRFKRRIRMIEKHADLVVAISRDTRDDVVRLTKIDTGRVIVAYPGISQQFRKIPTYNSLDRVRRSYNLPKSYLLFVGTREPRKNLRRLLEALRRQNRDALKNNPLLIVGDRGWGTGDKLPWFTRTLGFVPDADLLGIYAQATGLVYPSLKEGFGLPVAEAFATGIPVVTSNTSSLREIGSNVAILVDPYQVTDIARGIRELLSLSVSRRKRMTAEGRKQVLQFTFEDMANTIMSSIRK